MKKIVFGLVLSLVFQVPGFAQLEEGIYSIQLRNGKALDLEAAYVFQNGIQLMIHDYWGGENQKWRVQKLSGGTNRYRITCLKSERCLTADNQFSNNGCPVRSGQFFNNSRQQWIVTRQPDGRYKIQCAAGGKVLDAPNHNSNGSRLHLWDDWGGDNQRWFFKPVPPESKGSQLRIRVKSGNDGLRERITFKIHGRDGKTYNGRGQISGDDSRYGTHVGQIDIIDPSNNLVKFLAPSEIEGITINFHGAGNDFGETDDNWDMEHVKVELKNGTSTYALLYDKPTRFRFTTNESNKFRISF